MNTSHPNETAAGSDFSLGRVFRTVLLLVLIIAAGIGGWYLYQNYSRPQLVPAGGRVFLNGEPMTEGSVTTKPLNSNVMGALAVIQSDGSFELLTNGEPGAYTGEHQVVVTRMTEGFPPQLLVPPKYADFASTPFHVEVSRDADANVYELQLEGEVRERTGPPASPTPPAAPDGEQDPAAEQESEAAQEPAAEPNAGSGPPSGNTEGSSGSNAADPQK